ncbi:30S ribosomal protein S13 [Candidatus Woesearchaeota archaeon]|nr:30S ribosomal protein S13 [Candidatus Woesearchaeota archaeon]
MVEENFRHIVRVANTDLDGNKPIFMALHKIKGVGFMFSHAICQVLNMDAGKKTGLLSEKEVEQLSSVIRTPESYKIPSWLYNRRKDVETGDDLHLSGSDLSYTTSNDIKAMMKLKTYRGVRHSFKLPSRGQNTKSNFRKSKVKNAAKRKRT